MTGESGSKTTTKERDSSCRNDLWFQGWNGLSFPFLRSLWQICGYLQSTCYGLTLEGGFTFADREFENDSDMSTLPFVVLFPLLKGDK